MVPASSSIHKFSYAASDTSSNAMFEIREAYARSYGKILCEDGGTWAAPTIALKGALNHDTGMCMLPGYGSNIGADRQLSFSVDGNVRVFIHGDNDYNGNANILQIGIQGAANTNGNIIRTGNNFLQFQATTATGPISQYIISGSSTHTYSHVWKNRNNTEVMRITRDDACLAMGAGSSPSITSYTWMGNGDTGMYSPSNDTIGFSTNGVSRMFITNSNVSVTDEFLAYNDINCGNGHFTASTSAPMVLNSPSDIIFRKIATGNRLSFTPLAQMTATSFFPGTNGTITLGGTSTRWGQIYSSVSTLSTSDDRLKINESFIRNAMSTLNKLRPQEYDKYVNIDYASDSNAVPFHESGLIAQEVFYDAPELRHIVDVPDTADSNVIYTTHVPSSADPTNDPADYSVWGSNAAGIRYEGFIPYIIEALKEKDAEIQNLIQRMASVEARI